MLINLSIVRVLVSVTVRVKVRLTVKVGGKGYCYGYV